MTLIGRPGADIVDPASLNPKIARFLEDVRPATPCLVLDLDVVAEQYRHLTQALPLAKVYYAIKANPAP
ncbi:MAG TPA: hypothetical protein VF244_10630, partial [Acidimicrobiales bacterium]